jgi:signal transduction histidine kinase/ActR/RegA family two-component response regulator
MVEHNFLKDSAADQSPSRKQLLQEITALREQVANLEQQVKSLKQAAQADSDIMDLVEAEKAARESAEVANRLKDEFLAVLSHELRSPLNPILGWTKMLRTRQFSPDMTARALAAIERNAELQVQLIEDLLDVSQIWQGKLRLNTTNVDLVAVVEAALATVRLAAESKLIDLQFTKPDPVWLIGDAARLQQIVWNLLSNAIKFTPTEGKIQVEIDLLDLDRQKRSPTGPSVQLRISDNGQGISPAFLPYMFDSFRQAESAITRQFGGLGLGLTIVRHLVELHGGKIQAESLGEGQGATFRVTLPLLRPLQQSQPDPVVPLLTSSWLNALNQVRVLIVEDDADMRDYLGVVLSEAGANVALASSAGEALAKLSRFHPHVLICDIGLPNVDGCSLLRQIRTLVPELGGQVPAIALTAYTGEYNQQHILSAGFQLHVAKPVAPDALLAAVSRLVAP